MLSLLLLPQPPRSRPSNAAQNCFMFVASTRRPVTDRREIILTIVHFRKGFGVGVGYGGMFFVGEWQPNTTGDVGGFRAGQLVQPSILTRVGAFERLSHRLCEVSPVEGPFGGSNTRG